MKIFLIGMPGSGKTTLAKQVAEEMNLSLVDLDEQIEIHEQKTVSEIFNQNGEDHFRQVESNLLRQWAGSQRSFVMSTGGGAPCFFKGIDVINQNGISVYLDVPIAELARRVSKKSGRPLLDDSKTTEELEKKLKSIRDKRLWFYDQAHITLTNPTLQNFLKALQFGR
jgi:shikimate kinase